MLNIARESEGRPRGSPVSRKGGQGMAMVAIPIQPFAHKYLELYIAPKRFAGIRVYLILH